MLSIHLILCCPLLLLPSGFLSIRVFLNELALCIRWPKDWSFSFSNSPSNEYSGLISFRIDWFSFSVFQKSFNFEVIPEFREDSMVAQTVKNLPSVWETWVWSLGWEDPLDKGKATHSGIIAWRIPWTIVYGITESDTTEWFSFHLDADGRKNKEGG